METENNLKILKELGLKSFTEKRFCEECNKIQNFNLVLADPETRQHWECENMDCKQTLENWEVFKCL